MYKYRAWDKEKKVMRDIVSIWLNDDGTVANVVYRENDTVETLFINFILMQSTGLKDKNGVEIFEGDVVNVSNHPFQKREDGLGVGMKINGNYEVGWNKEDLTYVAGSLLLFRIKSYISVVGNIHANPELLKEVE